MPWFLVDDDFPTDPRVLATSLAARGLWVTAGTWSSKRAESALPDHVLASLGGTPELAAELVAAGLWKRVRGGYRFITEGVCKMPVKETVDNQRKLKNERQKRWREAQRRRDVDASTAPSTWSPDPDPDPVADVVNQVNGGSGARASPEVIETITKEIMAVTGRHVTDEWAGRIAGQILQGRAIASPTAYVRQAIRNDPDPRHRFLPLY